MEEIYNKSHLLSFYREEEKNIKNNLKKLRSENWETQNDNIILKNLNSKNKFNFIYKNFAFSVYISVHEHIINILHEYQFNKELWEVETKIKFSDVNYDNIILKIFINKELISKLVTNEINSYGFRSYINYLYNENRKINYNIDSSFYKDKSFVNLVNKIEQPEFKIKLFDYQLRNLYSMIHMEKGHKFKISANFPIICGNNKFNYDMLNEKINFNNEDINFDIKLNGGILADEMGLGKTITSLSLIDLNKSTYTEVKKNNKIYTKATLIICPAYLTNQWKDEIKKLYGSKKKVLQVLTKTSHSKLLNQDFQKADIIITSNEFLSNFNYYARLGIDFYFTPSRLDIFSHRVKQIVENTNHYYLDKKEPENHVFFECFHFHRIIIDEGHDIINGNFKNINLGCFLKKMYMTLDSDYRWFISGTPFENSNNFNKILKFLKINASFNDYFNNIEHFPMITGRGFLQKQILEKIIIRNQKKDLIDEIDIKGYEEEIIWIKLTKLEKKFYDLMKDKNNFYKEKLQQIVCHPLVAESYKNLFGNSNQVVNLDEIQDKLIEHHEIQIDTYTKKIENIDKNNNAYYMIKSIYQNKIKESEFILKILKNIHEKIDNKDDNCIVCLDEYTEPVITVCGHIYCKECIDRCNQHNTKCPTCKKELKNTELISITNSNKESESYEKVDAITKKYGSKLGKLIYLIKTLITNENNRIIIFSQWDNMLKLIGASLLENDIENSFVKGNVYCKNAAIKKFKSGINTNGNPNRVIMLSLKNTASGITLTEATHIFFVEPIDKPENERMNIELQAIGRVCRIGQKEKTKIIRILTKDTVEEEIFNNKFKSQQDTYQSLVV
jgi:SWI/SNF-related matrix-associated actin-dependent regulator of chromatin subfamily A3